MTGGMPSEQEVSAAVEQARQLLEKYGYQFPASTRELLTWLTADTPYPNPPIESVLKNPYLVIHEIVEITEAKGAGLTLARDVIVKNMQTVSDAHLVAAVVEFDVAAKDGAVDHLRARYADLQSWCEDPLLTPNQRVRYEEFRTTVERRLLAGSV